MESLEVPGEGGAETGMRLFSYIVKHDTGFSPNPFWGYCTLADCKPTIRRTANVGDWIVGLSPKASGNKVVYAMEVDEILDYSAYFRDTRFRKKIPDYSDGRIVCKTGDNIYERLSEGRFRQLRSTHSNGEEENPRTKAHDLKGLYVLMGKRFHYFGSAGLELPAHLKELKVGRGHRCRFSQQTVSNFLTFISAYDQGVLAPPTRWPIDDKSWRQEGG
jgi:hypothetical protein